MLNKTVSLIAALTISGSCVATGWHDFALDIGDGYAIHRNNSTEVVVGKRDGGIVLFPEDYGVSRVEEYIVTDEHIFTRHGRGDAEKRFFVITKENDEVAGPLSEHEFGKRSEVNILGSLRWQTPVNRNRLLYFSFGYDFRY
ncbi:MAG: hypothetical protein VCB26_07395 [Candidatus Hydrogenedentota bacterium]|jgi:hypothetical protein